MEANPLTLPYPWWYEIYERIKLAPWWITYKLGISKQARLQDKIVNLAFELGLQDTWVRNVINFAITEFSKKGLGIDYYGYHNIDHELEATYFTLLIAKGLNHKLTIKDIYYLFLASLFHDFDPFKDFDRPNEGAVEYFLRSSKSIKRFVEYVGLDINIIIAMIYRTAYPFTGKIMEDAMKRINELFDIAGLNDDERVHYLMLGWLVSLAERIAGYALRDENGAMELAIKNAHALGWHLVVVNRESIRYFNSMFENEREMLELVLSAVDNEYRNRLLRNVEYFKKAYNKELEVKEMIRQGLIKLNVSVEHEYSDNCINCLLRLHKLLPLPLRMKDNEFIDKLKYNDTLLITLRVNGPNNNNSEIVGYCRGGALEHYRLRRGTHDENRGKKNTIYLEPISIDYPYWGVNGGHLLRYSFILEAKRRGYRYLTAYAHRSVIEERIARGEPIEIACKYNPDRYDYYRYDLTKVDELDIKHKIEVVLKGL